MITIAAKDERIARLLRCGAPRLLVLHLKTDREPGKWASHRFFVSLNRDGESFPMVTGDLVFTAGEDQGISATMVNTRLYLGEEEWEPVEDEEARDAVALAVFLYVAGARLMEIKDRQQFKREALDMVRRLEAECKGERETERTEKPRTSS